MTRFPISSFGLCRGPAAVCGCLLWIAVPAVFGAAAQAQNYPVKPIRFIAPNLPGGPTDILARLIGQKLAESLVQPVAAENRAGAAGNTGTQVAPRAPPDAYTLVTGKNATCA